MIRPHSFILLDLNFRKVNNIKESTDAILVANKETLLEVSADNGNASITFTRHYLSCYSVADHCVRNSCSEEVEI